MGTTTPKVELPTKTNYSADYLNPVPQSAWGSSSKEYGQVSESGVVEKTPSQIASEVKREAENKVTLPVPEKKPTLIEKGKAFFSEIGKQGKELAQVVGKKGVQFLSEYSKYKEKQEGSGKPQNEFKTVDKFSQNPQSDSVPLYGDTNLSEIPVTYTKAMTMINQAETRGAITSEEADAYRKDVTNQMLENQKVNFKENLKNQKFVVVDRVLSSASQVFTPKNVAISAGMGAGIELIAGASEFAIASGVPALQASGIILGGSVLVMGGIELFKQIKEFKTLEAPEQLGIIMGAIPLTIIGAGTAKATRSLIDFIPKKGGVVSRDMDMIAQTEKNKGLVVTEPKQTITDIPLTETGLIGKDGKIFSFKSVKGRSGSFYVVTEDVPKSVFKTGEFGKVRVDITTDLNSGIKIANVFYGESKARSYYFTPEGTVTAFNVISKGGGSIKTTAFFSGKFKVKASTSYSVVKTAELSKENIFITQKPKEVKSFLIENKNSGIGAGGITGKETKFNISRNEGLGITIKGEKIFRSEIGDLTVDTTLTGSKPYFNVKNRILREFELVETPKVKVVSGGKGGATFDFPKGSDALITALKNPAKGKSTISAIYGGEQVVAMKKGFVSFDLKIPTEVVSNLPDVKPIRLVEPAKSVLDSGGASAISSAIKAGEISTISGVSIKSELASKREIKEAQRNEMASGNASGVKLVFGLKQKSKLSEKISTESYTGMELKNEVNLRFMRPTVKTNITTTKLRPKVKASEITIGFKTNQFTRTRMRLPSLRPTSTSRSKSLFGSNKLKSSRFGSRTGLKTILTVERTSDVEFKRGIKKAPQSQILETRFLKTARKNPATYSLDPFRQDKKTRRGIFL